MATRFRGSNGRFLGAGQNAGGSNPSITIEIDARAALRALNDFGERSFADLMETLGAVVKQQTVTRIIAEKTSPDGVKWPPLTAATLRKKGSGKGILVDRSRLYQSIDYTASSRDVVVGTNVHYAGFLQSGTKRMPARPFLGISEANMVDIRKAVDAWVEGAF